MRLSVIRVDNNRMNKEFDPSTGYLGFNFELDFRITVLMAATGVIAALPVVEGAFVDGFEKSHNVVSQRLSVDFSLFHECLS